MQIIKTLKALRATRSLLDGSLGLVPTMGALHAGHTSLVDLSKAQCNYTAVSIFINPKQFNDTSDLSSYPRNIEADLNLLEEMGVDLVWLPSLEEVYPPNYQTFVEVRDLSLPLEGAARTGHFTGVATIVAKLLIVFQPQRAYFGRKDAQQLAVVNQLAFDLALPVTIIGCPTIRTPDGLALSSRNMMLSKNGEKRANAIYRGLFTAGKAWLKGERQRELLLCHARHPITKASIDIEYLSLANPATLQEFNPTKATKQALISVAASVDGVRLIDNLILPDDLKKNSLDTLLTTSELASKGIR